MDTPIYFDNNATTPCDPQVVEKMLPYFSQWYGNPSNGLHSQGRKAARAIDEAREQIAALIGARPGEILFSAGATESNNLAILGVARSLRGEKRKRIVTSAIEHKAVLLPCKHLQEEGFEVVILPVDQYGRISIEDVSEAITDQTLLISLQTANNEIGTLQPIQDISMLAREKGVLVHCDAAQTVGKCPIDVEALGADFLSLSAHKFYGPKGIGALYIRGGSRSLFLTPLLFGGGQENGLRSGTSNVPAIVGMGEAARLAIETVESESHRISALRDNFEQSLMQQISGLRINGFGVPRLPNTSSLTFPGVDADAMLLNLPDVLMGTGSACTSGAMEPSHVLTAIGLSREQAGSTIRASLGRFTSADEIEFAISSITEVFHELIAQL
jgi:cysteine desulfurase